MKTAILFVLQLAGEVILLSCVAAAVWILTNIMVRVWEHGLRTWLTRISKKYGGEKLASVIEIGAA